ncbi:DUF485 domain-containing protein [Methylobacterium gnaphalii]|uniref:DUF485 domain-containing protein n=1 Tax=Methylobacterium gnaphalii TaxID=1010610 RepID=A0A512JMK0_9HYPH|nr:DUF485 domain-containing protein [Methylobacterium gnaphalii]GEP11206.1 hypothetical protein MGN01_30510 [Methylobacterium gnaphalii]GJD70075.1 Inner membrane protein YjcH [Methylobacterium gnaphalii]GLS49711.1 hypothetical protein GCM10007885_25610 [Methylobacterium gnaphalii]
MLSPDKVVPPGEDDDFGRLSRTRSRVAVALSIVMIAMYFGFMTMFAFAKPTMGMILAPGLSLCILLGAGVIVGSFVLCLVYVVWANRFYDPAVRRIMS